ncbi:polymorphic toxin-type HINT domain-containing protein, partial [Maricaulis sp. D1M11]|uniref:polymorphic toxin-type HINT domain-containing protein n=1 Tax=Maricaulis sp. D1M11 TaxID=3076117 RepID=UPI0039B5227F
GNTIGDLIARGACFVAGTAIHTPDGLRPIEDIRVGDWVYARSDRMDGDATVKRRQVLELYQYDDRKTLSVEVSRAGRTETLQTTALHPFAVVGADDRALTRREARASETSGRALPEVLRRLVEAPGNASPGTTSPSATTHNTGELAVLERAGAMWVKAADLRPGDRLIDTTGDTVEVISVTADKGHATVYNFAVDQDHTYYVGEAGVWVHNSCNFAEDIEAPETREPSGVEIGYLDDQPAWIVNPDGSRSLLIDVTGHGDYITDDAILASIGLSATSSNINTDTTGESDSWVATAHAIQANEPEGLFGRLLNLPRKEWADAVLFADGLSHLPGALYHLPGNLLQGLETGIRTAHGNVLRYAWEPDFKAEIHQQAAEADKIWLLAGAGYGAQQTLNGLVDFASSSHPIDMDYVLGSPRLDLIPQPEDNVFDMAYFRFGEFAFYGADLAFGSHGVGNLGRGARAVDDIVTLGPRSQLVHLDDISSGPLPSETSWVFRVQGSSGTRSSKPLISLDHFGNPRIQRATLNISIGDPDHALYYLRSRRPGGEIVGFKIPTWLDEFVQTEAVPQLLYRSNPRNQGGMAPRIVDPNQPGRTYELPPVWADWLEEYAVEGSGVVIRTGD